MKAPDVMKSCFYIACHTHEQFTPDQYVKAAGDLACALHSILGDKAKVQAVVKGGKSAEIAACHSEVEIVHDEQEGLIGKCVVDLQSPKRLQIDKSRFTALLKAATDYPAMKIEKRAVVMPEDAFGEDDGVPAKCKY